MFCFFVQAYAAERLFATLQSPRAHETVVSVGGYVLGEFGYFIAEQVRARLPVLVSVLCVGVPVLSVLCVQRVSRVRLMCLSVRLSASPSVCLPACLPACLCDWLAYLSVCLPACLPIVRGLTGS